MVQKNRDIKDEREHCRTISGWMGWVQISRKLVWGPLGQHKDFSWKIRFCRKTEPDSNCGKRWFHRFVPLCIDRRASLMISCTVIPAIVQRLCFSINVQHLSCFPAFVLWRVQRWERLKHRWERLPKTHRFALMESGAGVLHIYGKTKALHHCGIYCTLFKGSHPFFKCWFIICKCVAGRNSEGGPCVSGFACKQKSGRAADWAVLLETLLRSNRRYGW